MDRDIAALDEAAAEDAAKIATLAVDDDLLAQGAAIDALRERLGAVRKAIEDLPKRRQDRHAAEARLNDAAQRLGLASHAELLAKLPTDPALAQARSLIEQIKQAETAIGRAEERAARSARQRDEFLAGQSAADVVVDVEQARQRFNALGDIAGQADLWRRDSATLKHETDQLAAQVASLASLPRIGGDAASPAAAGWRDDRQFCPRVRGRQGRCYSASRKPLRRTTRKSPGSRNSSNGSPQMQVCRPAPT